MTGLTQSLQNPGIPLILLTQTASTRCSRHLWAAARPIGIHRHQRPLSSMKVFWDAVKESSSSPVPSPSTPSNVATAAKTATSHSALNGSRPPIFRTGTVNPQMTQKVWETKPIQPLKSSSEVALETVSKAVRSKKSETTTPDTRSANLNSPRSTRAPASEIAPETAKPVENVPQTSATVSIQTEADEARVEVGQAVLDRAIEGWGGIDPDTPFINFTPKRKPKTKRAIQEESIPPQEYEPRPPRVQKSGPTPAIVKGTANSFTGAVRWAPPTATPRVSVGDHFNAMDEWKLGGRHWSSPTATLNVSVGDHFDALDERKLEPRERTGGQFQQRGGVGSERGVGGEQWRQSGPGADRRPSFGGQRDSGYRDGESSMGNRIRSRDGPERRPVYGNQRDSGFRVRDNSGFGAQRGGREGSEYKPSYGGQRDSPRRERDSREFDNQRGGRYNSERSHNSYTPQHKSRTDSTRYTPRTEEGPSYASRSGSWGASGWNKGGSTFGSGGSAQRSSDFGSSGPRRRYYSTESKAPANEQMPITTAKITGEPTLTISNAQSRPKVVHDFSNKIFTTVAKDPIFRTNPINQSKIFNTYRIFQGRIWRTELTSKIWKTNTVGPIFKTAPALPRKPKLWSTIRATPFETKIWNTVPVNLAVSLKVAQKLGIQSSKEKVTPLALPSSRRIAIRPSYKDTVKDENDKNGTKIWNTVRTPRTWGEIPRPINYNPGGDPITLFFRTYFPEFDFNHRARYMYEWQRLWRSRGWHHARENIAKYSKLIQNGIKKRTASPEEIQSWKERRTHWQNTLTYGLFARRLFRAAMVKAFRVDFGGPLRDNLAWSKLCDQAGVKLYWNDPLSCAKAIARKMIPLVDLHEDYRLNTATPTPEFTSTEAYYKYSIKYHKFFEPSLLANIAVNIPEKEHVSEILLCLISQKAAIDSISPWQKKTNKIHHDRITIRQGGPEVPIPIEKKAKYVLPTDPLDTNRSGVERLIVRRGYKEELIRRRTANREKMVRQEKLREMTSRMRVEAQNLKTEARKKAEWDRFVEKRKEEKRLEVAAKSVERILEPSFSVVPVKMVPPEILKMLGEKVQKKCT